MNFQISGYRTALTTKFGSASLSKTWVAKAALPRDVRTWLMPTEARPYIGDIAEFHRCW